MASLQVAAKCSTAAMSNNTCKRVPTRRGTAKAAASHYMIESFINLSGLLSTCSGCMPQWLL